MNLLEFCKSAAQQAVRRTLEATCLILDAAKAPRPSDPPKWNRVKQRLKKGRR